MLGELLATVLRRYYFRGKGAALNALLPDRGERTAKVFGQLMRLDLADQSQRMIFMGCYEPRETAIVRAWLGPGMTVVDAGANLGYYTALAASVVGPSGSVIAIEPSPIYEKLVWMIEHNRLQAFVRPLRLGLSDAVGQRPIYLGSRSNYNPTMVPHAGLAPLAVVECRTLDTLAEQLSIAQIDLLKLDVEGHEPAIIRGAPSLFALGRIRAILCEFNDYWLRAVGSNTAELARLLRDRGFRHVAGPQRGGQPAEGNHFFVLERVAHKRPPPPGRPTTGRK